MLRLVLIIFAVYALVCGFVYLKQRALIYYPTNESTVKTESGFSFENEGARILVDAFIDVTQDTVLYFGGNAEDVSYTLADIVETFPGHSVYLMRYRGYGGSEGSPSEAALVSDALALFDQVTNSNSRVTVIGRSLGSGIATQVVASRPTVQRMVLVTPFDSIVNIAKRQFWFLPINLLLRERYESSRIAGKITVPTTIIAAAKDTIIPIEHSRLLYETFRDGVAEFIVIEDAGHNNISMSARYRRALRGQLN